MLFGGFGLAEDTSASLVDTTPADSVSAPTQLSARTGLHLVQRPAHVSTRREPVLTTQLVVIDFAAVLLATAAAFAIALWVDGVGLSWSALLIAALPLLWVAFAAIGNAYDLRFVGVGSAEFSKAFRTFIEVALALAVISYVGRLEISRGLLLVALPGALVAVWVARYVARLRLHRTRRAGYAQNRVLAVGSAASVLSLAASMQRDPTTGLHVVAACLPEVEARNVDVRAHFEDVGIAFLGSTHDVGRLAESCEARSVAVVAGDVGTDALRTISWDLEGTDRDLIVSTGLVEIADQRLHVQSVAGLPLLRVDQPTFTGFRQLLKAVFDRAVAGVALIVLLPLFGLLVLVIRCTSAGPAFYRQTRVGRAGKPFRMTKFRSMYVGADTELAGLSDLNEAADGLLFKLRDDPRVTPVGRFIRRMSLDELPQLVQVVTGRMSLVGPRPPLPGEVARYSDDVRRRLLVKPGLTGLWQVSGRSDLSWEESVRLDLHYVENWSLGLDLVVLLKTAGAVLRPRGAY